MAKKLIEMGRGEKYFFYIDKKSGGNSTENFRCRLTMPIEPDVLVEATRKAVAAFPLFLLRPVLNHEGYVYLTENDELVEVYPESVGSLAFGTEETNGYLFKVVYSNDLFAVHAHHSLGDGRIIMGFMMSIAYQYLILKGIEIDTEGMIYSTEDLKDPSLMDEFLDEAHVAEIDEPKDVYIPQNAFNYMDGEPDTDSNGECYRITWAQSELMNKVHTLEVTPTPFFAAVMATAFERCKEIGDKHIVAGVPVDMRARMNSRSQRNYIGNIRLPFYPEWRELSFVEKVIKLKEEMKKQMYFPNIITRVRTLEKIVDKMEEQVLYKQDMEYDTTQKAMPHKDNMVVQTYLLTNLGRLALPKDMAPYIVDVILSGGARAGNISVGLLSVGDVGNMILSHPFKSEKIVKTICEVLSEQGINASYEWMALEEGDTLGISRFRNV